MLFLSIRPPPELLPMLGPLEWYMTPTLEAALLYSSRAGSVLGRTSDWLRSLFILITQVCESRDLINIEHLETVRFEPGTLNALPTEVSWLDANTALICRQ